MTAIMSVRRVGLGYEGTVVAEGVQMNLDRITDSRGEMYGELTVVRAPEGHLMRQRFNVSSVTARNTAAKYLSARSNHIDWLDVLERFCVRTMDLERQPPAATWLGGAVRRQKAPMALYPLMPHGKGTILFGAEGSYKSTIAAAIALAVSTGVTPFPGWEVQQPRHPVLVLDWEADEADWNDRLMGLAAGVGYPDVPQVRYMACAGPITSLLHQVSTMIAEDGFGTVIVDSVGMASPQRHEGSDANESAIRLFAVLRQWGITSLLIDHIPKDGSGHRPYGSTYKPALARATWEVEASEEVPGSVTLFHRKANDMARQSPVGMMVVHDEGEIRLMPETWVPASEPRELRGQVALIHDAISEAGHALADSEIAAVTGLESNKVRAVLSKPQNRSLFSRVPGGWAIA